MFFRERRTSGTLRRLPMLSLRDLVILPLAPVSFIVGREKSVLALNEALKGDKEIFLAAQRDPNTTDPEPSDVFQVGTIAVVVQVMRLPDNTQRVLVDGRRRGRIVRFLSSDECFRVEVDELGEPVVAAGSCDALIRGVRQSFDEFVKLGRTVPHDALLALSAVEDPVRLAYELARHLPNLKTTERQALLESNDVSERLERVLRHIHAETEALQGERKRQSPNRKSNPDSAPIRDDKDEFRSELAEIEARIQERKLPPESADRAQRELRKLRMMSPMSAEATVVRNYLDWIVALPWAERTEDRIDLTEARAVLDADHYGLRKVKERILEYLAVVRLVGKLEGPILCLVGPPGVGKTSLARSVARATNRNFVRMALGGVRDEAEIRGHRRTYIGALPGKIVQGMKKAAVANPVFLLDEIDKMSADFRGDPSAALLEVLDREQNGAFVDHYLDLEYDLSQVMFICTANTLDSIPPPLRDRLEIVQIPGYTQLEKLAIAQRHLIPRQMELHGLRPEHLAISREAIERIITAYTREAGVRNLERELAAVCRKVARRVVEREGKGRVRIDAATVERLLGVPRYRASGIPEQDSCGFVNGLAWTAAGGVMVPIEAVALVGTGKTTMTGQLGNVFRESCEAAITYMRSRSEPLGLERDFWQRLDIHVHVPELWGVDGPSAGITLATAVVSAICKVPVRRDVAMTGEITLRGQVRPIGGLKEKLLAAMQAGVRRVLIPKDNEKDLRDVPRRIQQALEIVLVQHMDEVLGLSLAVEDPSTILKGIFKASEPDSQENETISGVPS